MILPHELNWTRLIEAVEVPFKELNTRACPRIPAVTEHNLRTVAAAFKMLQQFAHLTSCSVDGLSLIRGNIEHLKNLPGVQDGDTFKSLHYILTTFAYLFCSGTTGTPVNNVNIYDDDYVKNAARLGGISAMVISVGKCARMIAVGNPYNMLELKLRLSCGLLLLKVHLAQLEDRFSKNNEGIAKKEVWLEGFRRPPIPEGGRQPQLFEPCDTDGTMG